MAATYKVRVTWWSREGWRQGEYSTEGSRPAVAIKRAIDSAEFHGAPRKGILGAVIFDGPPGFILPSPNLGNIFKT